MAVFVVLRKRWRRRMIVLTMTMTWRQQQHPDDAHRKLSLERERAREGGERRERDRGRTVLHLHSPRPFDYSSRSLAPFETLQALETKSMKKSDAPIRWRRVTGTQVWPARLLLKLRIARSSGTLLNPPPRIAGNRWRGVDAAAACELQRTGCSFSLLFYFLFSGVGDKRNAHTLRPPANR